MQKHIRFIQLWIVLVIEYSEVFCCFQIDLASHMRLYNLIKAHYPNLKDLYYEIMEIIVKAVAVTATK